jgi:purine-binding chemotaxis protein CheW
LPRAPELVEGVIDLRGVIIPVVDLGRALGGAPVEHDASARIAIVEIDGLAFGLRAEAASEVLAVNGSDVQSPPALVAQSGYDAIRAVVRRRGTTPVLVLALEAVLESVYRSGLREATKEAASL